jgi:acyl carrier protein
VSDVSDTMIAAVKIAVTKIKDDIVFSELTPDTRLLAVQDETPTIAFDSLDMLELLILLEEEYGVEILDTFDPAEIHTIADLARTLAIQSE